MLSEIKSLEPQLKQILFGCMEHVQATKGGPFFINGVASDQRFSEMLFRQGTDRLLATPIYSRGRMVGFIDMRDKAGKKPFDHPDVEAAKQIANDVLTLLGAKNLFGVAPIPVEPDPAQELQRAAA